MPTDWNGGTVTAQFYWFAQSASLNNVVWGIQARAYSDGSAIDQAYGAAQETTDANTGNTFVNISEVTAALTIAGASAGGQHVQWQVFRDGTNGSDNLAATAELFYVLIQYTRM
jgi:hypothetical protein